MRGSVSAKPSRRRRCSGGPSVIVGQLGSGRRSGTRSSWSTKCGKWNDTQPATPACAAGTKRCTAAQRSNRSMLGAPPPGPPSRARSARPARSRTSARRRRRATSSGNDVGRELADAVAQRRRIVGRAACPRGTSCSRAGRRSASSGRSPPRAPPCRAAPGAPARRRTAAPRTPPAGAPRRSAAPTLRAASASAPSRYAVEARRQRGVARGQLGAEACIQRRQPLGLVEIAVPEAVDTEREVSRLVARRASGAVREGKCRGGVSVLVPDVAELMIVDELDVSRASCRRRTPGTSDRAGA